MPLHAQSFPTKPTKSLVGVAPGGTTDMLARFLAQEVSKPLGQPALVDNRAGAGGNIAAEVVAKSAPDGAHFNFAIPATALIPASRAIN